MVKGLKAVAGSVPGRVRWTTITLLLLLVGISVLHIAFGRTAFSIEEVVKALADLSDDPGQRHIVWNLRLPRLLVAIAAGFMLGMAGAILQTILRNPLAEPGLIGATSGAVLFAVLWTLYAPAANVPLPFAALFGGTLASGAIYFLSRRGGNDAARLALTGAVATSVLQSVTSLLLLRNQEGLATILLWNFGSLNGRSWPHWNLIWPWGLALVLLAMSLARRSALLQLGDSIATGLGLRVNRTRLLLLLIAASLTAASVSVVGAIGFIGLIGPHIAALLVGRNPLFHFPVSGLFSALLLVAADWASQSVSLKLTLPGLEHHVTSLPAGAVTTLIGAPFFLYLLRKTAVKMRGADKS
ncbi:FecCD family ABC transporter permease [Cohnella algarum]|uniref:FecCD family ABC transporter permease n=1 Tax=Cohnella algarum TaxID=2044859 RepID=UPI001967854D|nr:iron ABC transporter permease [Cohnella algarum]MBN2984520.1 iron ABC transporter permease [Cohnella algarum]